MREKIRSLLKKDKKTLTLMTVAIVIILFLLIGSTYAFFAAQAGAGSNASINASTGATDSLSFSVGKDINLHVTMDDFLEGMESPHGETTATATLKANSVTNQASGRYNVFFIIDNNDFEYSTDDGKTELLLKVTDPNDNEVMDITGLKRVEGGFDITTRTGGFLIMADYDIEATPAENLKSQTWKLEVTFVNLDANQNINKGKTLNGRFYITTEQESTYELVEINSIETDISTNSITANLTSLAGTAEIEKYYYAIEEDTSGVAYLGAGVSVARLSNEIAINDTDYIESDQPTHTFNNLKSGTTYKVYGYAVDKNGIKSNIYETEVATADYFIPVIESVTTSNTTTSITVNTNSKRGSEEISKYYYSIDDGDFIESNEASHTFNDLAENTTHTIKVKAEDANGVESEIYTITAKTITLASITNVTTSVTASSVTVNVTAKKGDANIVSYYYSKDNGVTWSEATVNSSYTFNNLNSNTTYQIKVKVVDTEGRESSEAAATAKTDYVLASITNVTHSTTLNSITVNVTATAGSKAIVKYYYSKDNGSTYEESDNSSYTFDSLLDTTEYKIKIKVKDSDERYSTEYYEAISTVTYINPSVTTVNVDKTYNSISLTTTAAKGTNNVAKYYYKIDNGNWSDAQTTNTYNITSGLKENTKYTIYVKVEDSNGRMSNEYSLDVTTNTYVIPSVSATVTSSASSTTKSSITISATGTKGDGNIAKYMYSKDGGSNWVTIDSTSTSNSYIFEDLTPGATFQIRVKVVDNNNRESSIYSTSVIADFYALATYIKELYTSQGSNGIYYHDSSLANSAGDNSYRYAGANPNNFVCFGSNKYLCPSDNLYRIIGVFGNQVKLIKYDYASSDDLGFAAAGDIQASGWSTYKGNKTSISTYTWDSSSGSNKIWSNSLLSNALNTSYLDVLGNDWANIIANSTWHVGGLNSTVAMTSNAKNVYDYELGNSKVNETFEAKIGLTYLSEYYYAASPTYWTYKGNDTATTDYRAASGSNWMYMGLNEYTISKINYSALAYMPSSSVARLSNILAAEYAIPTSPESFLIYTNGSIQTSWTASYSYNSSTGKTTGYYGVYTYAIRPTFNLATNARYVSGTGSKTDPYRLNEIIDDTITFKIGNAEYHADKDMTWEQWVNSDYAKVGAKTNWDISDNTVHTTDLWIQLWVQDPATKSDVSLNAVIKDGYEYTFRELTCFAKDTLIYTVNGYKNIQDINVGDKVYSYNEETKMVEVRAVTQTFEHVTDTIYKLILEDGTIMKITPNHPVYDKNTQSWRAIEEFKAGDVLTTDTGKEVKITSMELLEGEIKVYNIEVLQNHNYFVTNKNILVHNYDVAVDPVFEGE